jgi:polysaccharide pyruvyl transferase WcaK-like protein
MQVKQRKKIGIFGYFGAGNLGDESVVGLLIEKIRQRWPDAEIYGICLDPDDTFKQHGIPSYPLRRLSTQGWVETGKLPLGRRILRRLSSIAPAELVFLYRSYRWLKGFDLIIVGGSGQLIDNEGGPWNHAYNHFKWARMAKMVKAKFALLSVGAGPIDTAIGRFFLRDALNTAMYRSFRDEYSRKLIQNIGVYGSNHLYPDQAFGINAQQFVAPRSTNAKPVVGIAPIAFYDPRHWYLSDPAVYAAYVAKMAQFVAWLVDSNHDVAFFHTQVNGDDVVIPDILHHLQKNGMARQAKLCRELPVANYKQAIAAISQTDLVVASRFHAILFSYLLRKPVVGISYHQKINDMMKTFGQGEFVLPIESFDTESLQEKFRTLEDGALTHTGLIERTMLEYRTLLNEQYHTVFSMLDS